MHNSYGAMLNKGLELVGRMPCFSIQVKQPLLGGIKVAVRELRPQLRKLIISNNNSRPSVRSAKRMEKDEKCLRCRTFIIDAPPFLFHLFQ